VLVQSKMSGHLHP